MVVVGLFAAILLTGLVVAFAAHVYEEAKAAGAFTTTPKGARGAGQRMRITGQRAPAKVSHIVAGAVAQNWVNKRHHIRTHGKPEKPPHKMWPRLQRLTVVGRTEPAAPKLTLVKPDPKPQPAEPAAAPGRTQPAMTTPRASANGSGSDLHSAVATLIGHARAGGMRSKGRTFAAFHEGFGQQAAALEQFSRDLQEHGQYGPEVWEPALKAAAHLRAAAAEMGEGSSALAALARTPMGEVATSSVNAPTREEINTE